MARTVCARVRIELDDDITLDYLEQIITEKISSFGKDLRVSAYEQPSGLGTLSLGDVSA